MIRRRLRFNFGSTSFRILSVVLIMLGHGLLAATTNPATLALDGYLPLWQRTGPSITDLALIYHGGSHRPRWTTNRFAPYVTHRSPATGTEQWLFDGFLMIELQDGRRNNYQPDPKMTPACREHWQWLLDQTFAADNGVLMLEATCRSAVGRIGRPASEVYSQSASADYQAMV